jgi:hypothetical protein
VTPGVARRDGAARVALETVLVFVAVLAYLWLFRLYGFDLVDEGTQLAQIDRVARGERPYLDFETGYTPGYFGLAVALWRASGEGVVATRTFGVVLHASTVALLFACVRAWFGAGLALALTAFHVAFLLPVSPRQGAPFNTPYPGWVTAPLALLAQALVARVSGRRAVAEATARGDAAGVWVAGLAAGLAFSIKPNAGLLALAGAGLALVPGWPSGWRSARVLGMVARAAAVALPIVLLGGSALAPAYALALLLPVVLAAVRTAPVAALATARPLVDAALLVLGFVPPVLVWLLPLLLELGLGRFAREVLLLDGGVVGAYLLPLSAPAAPAVALCAAGALALLRSARGAAALALMLGVAGAVALGGTAEPRVVVEEACLWLGPVVLVAGLLLVPVASETARAHALLAFAALFSLQLFPRPDLVHVGMGAPPVLLAGGAVLHHALRRPGDALASRAVWPRVAVAAVLAMVCAARAYPALRARLAEPLVPLELGPRAPLVVAAPYAAEQRWLGDAVRTITARSAPGDAVFTFPDLAGLGFLAERGSPFFYVYFVPGRPDREGERRTLNELERVAPRLAVTGAPRVPAFAGAESYFAGIASYLARRYGEPLHVGEVEVRERLAAP